MGKSKLNFNMYKYIKRMVICDWNYRISIYFMNNVRYYMIYNYVQKE